MQEDIETVNKKRVGNRGCRSWIRREWRGAVKRSMVEGLSYKKRKEEVLEVEHRGAEATEVEKEEEKANKVKSCIEQSEAKNTPRRSTFTVSAPVEFE